MPLSSIDKSISQQFQQIKQNITNALEKKIGQIVQSKADELVCENKKPDPEAVKMLEARLAAEVKKAEKANPGCRIDAEFRYVVKGDRFEPQVFVTPRMTTQVYSGGSYLVKPGDTLWDLSKKYYGNGGFWPEIAEANPKRVRGNGNFILAGTTLSIPKKTLPKPGCVSDAVTRQNGKSGAGGKTAVPVLPPAVGCRIDEKKTRKSGTVPLAGFGKLKFTAEVSGGFDVVDQRPIRPGFSKTAHLDSAKEAAAKVAKKIEINLPKIDLKTSKDGKKLTTISGELSVVIDGKTYRKKFTKSPEGELTLEIESGTIKGRVGKQDIVGKLKVTFRMELKLKMPKINWPLVFAVALVVVLAVLLAWFLASTAPVWGPAAAGATAVILFLDAQKADPEGVRELTGGGL